MMGGWGSGRHFSNTKSLVSHYPTLDIRELQRKDYFAVGNDIKLSWKSGNKTLKTVNLYVGKERVILSYHIGRDIRSKFMVYDVLLERTACHLGGERVWFLCPAKGCGRRVAILYGGNIFACRHCYKLAYPSQNETKENRATRKADKIRERLHWIPGILNPISGKPKGMHWKTYNQWLYKYNNCAYTALEMGLTRLNIKLSEISRWLDV